MEIYLSIIGTYLSISFTILIIYVYKFREEQESLGNKITKENRLWKKELRIKLSDICNRINDIKK